MPGTHPHRPIILVVPDGAGDRPYPELAGDIPGVPGGSPRARTPIEAARTPNLDALASLGRTGLLYPVGPGLAPSSHQAHFALFGYAPEEFPGRGLLEALGEGYAPAPGEVVVRANATRVTERDGMLWIDERPDPRTGEAAYLADTTLDAEIDGVSLRFVHTGALQGLLFLRPLDGRSLSHHVSDADPLHADTTVLAVLPLEEAPDADAADHTARVLNEWIRRSRTVLTGRPLDAMLVKWAGAPARFTPFPLRFSMRGVTLGSGPLYKGLGAAVGLHHREFGTARDPEADVAVRVHAALELMAEGYDFVHLHTKRTDMAGHRKDPARKAEVIAAVDRALAPLVPLVERDEIVVAVCPDHQTPAAGPLYHGGGAVPLLIAGGVAGADEVTAYGETSCAHGSLGVLRGGDVLPLALDAADRSAFLADRITGHLALGIPRAEDLKPLSARD
ncbi:alkaline phosphatase family protein [Anaerosoma tenue]|uniref:alkaline phosphatase family protein n=1 Tax=Anaerosoma tenue TaxID=2933588 RepID=UPI002260D3C3|nr:alkaline phosphatase family protein [Anaerosoma tenue]MCK8115296.1 alkaline phosphatase family protein [Anaerosoma tenue]